MAIKGEIEEVKSQVAIIKLSAQDARRLEAWFAKQRYAYPPLVFCEFCDALDAVIRALDELDG